ncbi:DNA/RNA non-specific endonuclease [Lactobacillus sp. Sy-1]|nr:DNA/RNA non-specific endonuclease [Lactobacillus sp. Sy-1]
MSKRRKTKTSKKGTTIGIIFAFLFIIYAFGSQSNGDNNSSSKQSSRVERRSSSAGDGSSKETSRHASEHAKASSNQEHSTSKVQHSTKHQKTADLVAELAAKNYHSGQAAYINVNGGNSTLKASDWTSNHIKYADLDGLNRTAAANTAYLESRNVANDSLRTTQTVYPTGWHQKFINHTAIINRGHMIAYSLSKGISVDGTYNPSDQSGDQNNPKNLFTQTAFSNQRVQTIYETKVRDALRDGERVIYQVQPIFRGSELMARGVHLQALSTNGELNFNVYLFNVQPGVVFDYSSGRSKIDHSMTVPTPAGAPTFYDNNSFGSDHRYRSHHSTWGTAAGAYATYRIYKHYRYHHDYYKNYSHPKYHYYHRY